MKLTYRVMRQELITTFSRPAYLIFAFGFPVLAVLILGGVRLIQGRSQSNTGIDPGETQAHQLEKEGFVDQAGLIHTVSEDLMDFLLPFSSEGEAQVALQAGQISAYYIIPEDYIANGEIYYVYPNDKPYLSDGQKWVIQSTLNLNLLAGDAKLADLIWNPIWDMETRNITPQSEGYSVSGEDCSRPGAACQSNELVRMIPSLLVVIFFIAFMSSSSMLFNAIGAEKENRTIELLLLSISPRQLLTGKTMALGIAGLLQTITWLIAIFITQATIFEAYVVFAALVVLALYSLWTIEFKPTHEFRTGKPHLPPESEPATQQ